MSQNFGWPQPAPVPAPRWRPHPATMPPPDAFDAASSIERIRAAQQAAAQQQAEAQQSQQAQADQVLSATGDFATNRDVTQPALEGWRNMQAGRFDNAQGSPENSYDPQAMAEAAGIMPNNPGFEPWRAPGALTGDQAAEQKRASDMAVHKEWFDGVKDWATSPTGLPMTASVLGQRANYQYRKGKAQQEMMDRASAEAGASMDQPSLVVTDSSPPSEQEQLAEDVVKDAHQAQMEAFPTGTWPNPVAPRPEMPAQMPSQGIGSGSIAGRQKATAQRQRQSDRKGPGGGWADPAGTKPMPGEETLPLSVAEWNQQTGGGMGRLQRAYQIESDLGMIGDMHFGEWLKSKGITDDLGPEEAAAKMDEIVARSLIDHPNGDPLDRGLADNRVNKDDDSILQGRAGLPDDIPLDLMTPEQRAKLRYDVDGTPRTARGGYNVWDQTAGERGAYVPRGVDMAAARQAQATGNYRQEAMIYGIDIHAYGDNDAMLKADVARERKRHERMAKAGYEVAKVEGGGMRYAPGQAIQDREQQRKGRQYISTMARRWASQMQQQGVPVGALQADYDAAVSAAKAAGSANPHLDAVQVVNQRWIGNFQNMKAQHGQIAWDKKQDQEIRSRQFGVPRPMVAFFDTLQAAGTPEEKANVLMLAHSQQPMMGWDRMAAMLMRGEMDAQALNTWVQGVAGKPKAFDQIGADVNSLQNAPLGMGAAMQAEHVARSTLGPNADPKQVEAKKREILLPSVRNVVLSGKPMDDNARAAAASVLDKDPETFASQLGLNPNDPRVSQVYRAVFGVDPPKGFWSGVGSGALALGGGLVAGGAAGLGALGSMAGTAIGNMMPGLFGVQVGSQGTAMAAPPAQQPPAPNRDKPRRPF